MKPAIRSTSKCWSPQEKEFHRLTVKLLIHKYLYYECDEASIPDAEYDRIERSWAALGRELGLLGPEDTRPCVGFDWHHVYAEKAAEIGKYVQRQRIEADIFS